MNACVCTRGVQPWTPGTKPHMAVTLPAEFLSAPRCEPLFLNSLLSFLIDNLLQHFVKKASFPPHWQLSLALNMKSREDICVLSSKKKTVLFA